MSHQQPIKQEYFVLFISHKCKECDKFLKLMQESSLVQSVKQINVHQLDPRQIPRQLTAVPAIMLETEQLYIGQEAFKWLENKLKSCFSGAQVGDTSHFSPIGDNVSTDCNDLSMVFGQPQGPQQGSQGPQQGSQGPQGQQQGFSAQFTQPNQPNQSNQGSPELPKALQPQKITNDGKFNDSEYNNILRQRDADIQIPKR